MIAKLPLTGTFVLLVAHVQDDDVTLRIFLLEEIRKSFA